VHWWRDRTGRVSFYDGDGERWVRWTADGDTPPLPPKWQMLGVPTRVTRPGWQSPWRIIPAVLVVVAVVVAILQTVAPSGSNTSKEARASAALLGRCLARSGSGFKAAPVACTSAEAAVKVVSVIPSTPGSPLCPSATRAVEIPYAGVKYLHIECVEPVGALPGGG
jgi:hypothetical protein